MLRNRLLLGVATIALTANGAALGQTVAPKPAAGAVSAVPQEQVVVFGNGSTRQTQSIRRSEILKSVPGVSPLKVLAKLPGVTFQSANALGTNEWSTRISVRAFSQSQLGFTLDNVPLGDMSYGNFNGLHISRAISSENVGGVDLAQGAGGLDTASSSNLGGTIKFTSIMPSLTPGAFVESGVGSHATYREYGRLDSGELANGFRAYLSGSYTHENKWKGQGQEKQWQVNGKFVQPLGPDATLTGFANYSDWEDDDYIDLSRDVIDRLGYNTDYIRYNFPLARTIATAYQKGTAFPAPYKTPDDNYYDGYGLRRDAIGGLTVNWDITSRLHFMATPYTHHDEGIGTWWTPYTPTPDGAPLSVRSTNYIIQREGITTSLTYDIARHKIEGSLWYEYNDFDTGRFYFPLANTATSSIGPLEWPQGAFKTQWRYDDIIKTYKTSLQDTWQIADRLKLNYGFASMFVKTTNRTVTGSPDINGTLNANKAFLPQIGANYRINQDYEVFADYARNVRSFTPAAFQTTQAAFNLIKNTLKPETSDTVEGGVRFHNGPVQASLAGFYVNFQNRLNAETVGTAIQGLPATLTNVGSVSAEGAEMAANWNIWRSFSLYGSYTFDHATYGDNEMDGNGVFVAATKGKYVVDTPQNIVNVALSYDDGSLYGNVNFNYQGRRAYTYTNDEFVSGRGVVDLTLGYRTQRKGFWGGWDIQGNITNLFNRTYIATIGENGFVDSDPQRNFASMLAGAPFEAFMTVRKKF